MIQDNIKKQIITIWDKYLTDNKIVLDTKGKVLEDIDERRIESIPFLKSIISDFVNGKMDIQEFKTTIDSFNKQNNYWGFTSIKGQMFFNLLLKTSESEEQSKKLTKLLKECIEEPKDLTDALHKVEALDKYTSHIFYNVPDKRKAPNPGSVCYFLSYFWQIHNPDKWPIMYTATVLGFTDLGIWDSPKTQKEAYNTFYNLDDTIKGILTKHSGRAVSNWDAEHAFWHFRQKPVSPKTHPKPQPEKVMVFEHEPNVSALKEASFNIYDYIPPITAKLVELGSETEGSAAAKGSKFEKAVCEVFRQLGFDVHYLGQGTGREPDLIAIYKEDNVAFIVDAKAYSNGYMLSAGDERAIREYISHHCPKLQKDGIKKIGFIIVSNAFKSGFESFINEMTWKTDIKRFTLIQSTALLHLLAYKIKDQLPLVDIIEAIIGLGSSITAEGIIERFDDI